MARLDSQIVIIGAGPGGLSCAYKLLKNGFCNVTILEQKDFIGGISTSVNQNGNIMDMGGHRYFTKNQEVLEFWNEILPFTKNPSSNEKDVMLIVDRFSHIYYDGKFFKYPLEIEWDLFKKLGWIESFLFGMSYLTALVFFRKKITTLADFMIRNFGYRLYKKFFKPYSTKVWGVSPEKIPAEWAVQRIKKVSVLSVLKNALLKLIKVKSNEAISMTDYFYYPRLGSIQLWEKTAEHIKKMGGKILFQHELKQIDLEGTKATAVHCQNQNHVVKIEADYIVSTVPIRTLVLGFSPLPSQVIIDIVKGLVYREWIGAGIILNKEDWLVSDLKDQWIYIEEAQFKIGRMEIFNNWSKDLLKNPETEISIMLEFFVDEGDELWQMQETKLKELCIKELLAMKMITSANAIIDFKKYQIKKAYPAYFNTYKDFSVVKEYLLKLDNILPLGRNGLHRYNNSDHSTLSGFVVADYLKGKRKKQDVWDVNADQEYHESNNEE